LSIEEILDSNEYRTKTAEISRIAGSMQSIPRACDIIEKLGTRN